MSADPEKLLSSRDLGEIFPPAWTVDSWGEKLMVLELSR